MIPNRRFTRREFMAKDKTEKGYVVTRASVSTRYGEIEFDLLRGGVRRLNLRVRRDGSVAVSVPLRGGSACGKRREKNRKGGGFGQADPDF